MTKKYRRTKDLINLYLSGTPQKHTQAEAAAICNVPQSRISIWAKGTTLADVDIIQPLIDEYGHLLDQYIYITIKEGGKIDIKNAINAYELEKEKYNKILNEKKEKKSELREIFSCQKSYGETGFGPYDGLDNIINVLNKLKDKDFNKTPDILDNFYKFLESFNNNWFSPLAKNNLLPKLETQPKKCIFLFKHICVFNTSIIKIIGPLIYEKIKENNVIRLHLLKENKLALVFQRLVPGEVHPIDYPWDKPCEKSYTKDKNPFVYYSKINVYDSYMTLLDGLEKDNLCTNDEYGFFKVDILTALKDHGYPLLEDDNIEIIQ